MKKINAYYKERLRDLFSLEDFLIKIIENERNRTFQKYDYQQDIIFIRQIYSKINNGFTSIGLDYNENIILYHFQGFTPTRNDLGFLKKDSIFMHFYPREIDKAESEIGIGNIDDLKERVQKFGFNHETGEEWEIVRHSDAYYRALELKTEKPGIKRMKTSWKKKKTL